MNQKTEEQNFRRYFLSHDEKDGVLREIKEDLKRIEMISDKKKKYTEADLCLGKHANNLACAVSHWNNGKLHEILTIDSNSTVSEYQRQIDKLRKICNDYLGKEYQDSKQRASEQKIKERKRKASHCAYCDKKSAIWHYIYDKQTKQLEQKPNKTPQEEADLAQKKNQLKDLEAKEQSQPTVNKQPFQATPWLVGGGCILVLVIIYVLFKQRKYSNRK